MVTLPQVHDLVELDPEIARRWPDAPAWVGESLLRASWAVVRRESRMPGIAIGIRGSSRCERYAASISHGDVARVVTPGDLVARVTGTGRLGQTFFELRETTRPLGVHAAPAGSFGFELASGLRTTTPSSDLDVLVRAEHIDVERLVAFGRIVDDIASANGVRIDVELLYACGAVALPELLGRAPTVLFKTATGPQLLARPA